MTRVFELLRDMRLEGTKVFEGYVFFLGNVEHLGRERGFG